MDFKGDIKQDHRGDIRKYFRESKVSRWTQEDLVVSAEVKEEYMTLLGRP